MNYFVFRFSSLGDIVLTEPVFENIKLNDPGGFVYFITGKEYREVFAENPYIDRIISVDDRGLLGTVAFLRKQKPSVVIDLHGSLRSRFLSLLVNTKTGRIKSYRSQRRRILAGKGGEVPSAVTKYLKAAASIGVTPHTLTPRLYLSSSEKNNARKMLGNIGVPLAAEIICVAPQARWKNKEWPRFRQFFEIAVKPGRYFLILGQNFEEAEKIMPESRHKRSFVKNICGQVDIRMLIAIVNISGCVISMDSGIAHIAHALSVPLIEFFGPTVPAFGFAHSGSKIMQVDIPCRPCHPHGGNICRREDRACLDTISEQDLFAALENMFAKV